MTGLRYGWIGDDFTGASDTLSEAAQAGLAAMLFLRAPDAARLARAAAVLGRPLDAVGIAGAARSMTPAAMAAELAPIGAFFAELAPRVLHYKVCSTFDSAPQVGSIGEAVRTLMPHVEHPLAFIVGGQPSLGRYCAFSNLFAAASRGGAVARLDRHPTMRQHPTTPMQEADLRLHLAAQGLGQMAAVHYPMYEQGNAALDAAVDAAVEAGAETSHVNGPDSIRTLLLDVAAPAHLAAVGALLWRASANRRLLAVGASSVVQALIAAWAGLPRPSAPVTTSSADRSNESSALAPALVVAGSLSPVTARQVSAARSYHCIRISPDDLVDAARLDVVTQRVTKSLGAGQPTLVVTAPLDNSADTSRTAETVAATARLVRELLAAQVRAGAPVHRLGLAGGDTSSLAAQGLGLWGLSHAGVLGPGVALCRSHADDPALDGLTLMLKGGQMGGDDVFEQFATA